MYCVYVVSLHIDSTESMIELNSLTFPSVFTLYVIDDWVSLPPLDLLPLSIMEAREFEWESQLRFYREQELDQLMVQQCMHGQVWLWL